MSSLKLTPAMTLGVLAAIGTAVAALVPAWAADDRVIVAALGAIVTVLFPALSAHSTRTAALQGVAQTHAAAARYTADVVAASPYVVTPCNAPVEPAAPVVPALSPVEVAEIVDARLAQRFAPTPPEPPAVA